MNELVVRGEVKCLVRAVTNRIKWTKNDKFAAADELEASIVGRSAIEGGECAFISFRWSRLFDLSLVNSRSNLKSTLEIFILHYDTTSNHPPTKTFSHSHLRFSHFRCNSLNISRCKQTSGVLFFSPFLPFSRGNYTENLQRKSLADFFKRSRSSSLSYSKKRITEFEKSQTKIVICMLEAS
jgi:hypothetical protein